jgi:outer membrane protein assembly factor BamB
MNQDEEMANQIALGSQSCGSYLGRLTAVAALMATLGLYLASITTAKAHAETGSQTSGEDWPTFLGASGDGKSSETGLIVPWPLHGPRIVWTRKLTESYGIGSVSRGKYYQFDYAAGHAFLLCLNATTGEQLWRFSYESNYTDMYGYNSGPRCSPVIDDDRVFLYGVEGMLQCLDANSGRKNWSRDMNREFGVIQNFFGVGSTPVVHNDLLIAMVGGSPAEDQKIAPGRLDQVRGNSSGIVAVDKRTGAVRYQITDELASYASMKISHHAGRPWCFAFARGGLVVFHPDTGKVDFQYPWRARTLESVNASTPVVVGDRVFLSETYGPGSVLLRFRTGGYTEIWKDDRNSRRKAMQTHWNTPIYHAGYLFGSSGRHEGNAELRCIEFETGNVMWSEPGLTRCSLLYVDQHFVCLGEDGTLRLLRANPKKYDLVSEVVLRDEPDATDAKVTDRLVDAATRLLESPAWAAPILSHGLMYVRGKDRVVCLELIPNSTSVEGSK